MMKMRSTYSIRLRHSLRGKSDARFAIVMRCICSTVFIEHLVFFT